MRPRFKIVSAAKLIWPASDITAKYSSVSTERNGRKPKRSNRAPTYWPLPKIIAAGPSFFSSDRLKYSSMARISGSMSTWFSHAGGIMATMASTTDMPSSTMRRAMVWSRRALSDWPLGKCMVLPCCLAIEASDRRFFLSVFNSPLCAMRRKGCAIIVAGSVLVEKRVWKKMEWISWSGSRKSSK